MDRPNSRKAWFDALHEYFRREDERRGVYDITGAGEFVPTNLAHLREGIERLMTDGVLPGDSGLWLDAGSGDGRVLLLLYKVFGLQVVGVEYDEALCARARNHIARFVGRKEKAFRSPAVLCGDFCEEQTYEENGLSFSDFRVIYNYANNHHALAEMIRRDGRSGAIFLLYGPIPDEEEFPGLECRRILLLGDARSAGGSYLHVYVKSG